ncbi:MAG: hypothetical protein AAF702_02825 [Chloroflexota bacterium]
MEIITSVSDEIYEELTKLTGQKVVHFILWDESLADAVAEKVATGRQQVQFLEDGRNIDSSYADIDLYLQEGVYFELYSAQLFPDIYSDPLPTQEAITTRVSDLIQANVWLDEIAVDEDDQLVLILSQQHLPRLYIVVGGWVLNGWEELPES